MLESSPRTPTPFKHALAEVERRAKAKEWVRNTLILLRLYLTLDCLGQMEQGITHIILKSV